MSFSVWYFNIPPDISHIVSFFFPCNFSFRPPGGFVAETVLTNAQSKPTFTFGAKHAHDGNMMTTRKQKKNDFDYKVNFNIIGYRYFIGPLGVF